MSFLDNFCLGARAPSRLSIFRNWKIERKFNSVALQLVKSKSDKRSCQQTPTVEIFFLFA